MAILALGAASNKSQPVSAAFSRVESISSDRGPEMLKSGYRRVFGLHLIEISVPVFLYK